MEFRIALDQNGILCFHKDRKQAPIIHFAAPFEFQFQFGEPTLYIGGDNEFRMIVGSPGYGPGTLAACFYDGLIPENAKPTATITYPTAKPDEKPRVETIALQGRTCRVNLYGEPKPGDVPGSATVEFSFDEWKEGKVMPLKLGVSIQPAPPRTGPPAEKVSGLLSASLKHPDRTSSFGSLQYSPDSKRLMTVGYPSGTIQFWDVATRQEKFTVQTNKGVRTSMDFAFLTPDWKTLFTSTQEENSKLVERDGKKVNEHRNSGRIRRWDLETKKELEPFNPPKGQGNIAAGMTSDGKYLYSAEVKDFNPGARFEMPLILLDASTGTRNEIGAGSYFHGQFFLPDNKSILLCSTKTFTVKSVPDGKVIATKTFDGEPGRHTQVVGISPDGKLIARNLGQEKDGTTSTVFLDAKTLDETARWTGQANPQQFGTTLGTFTPDSKQFLILDGKNDLQIWDVAAKKVARTIPVSIAGQNWRVAVSADSRWVAYPWMPKYESKNLPSRTTDPNEEPQTHIALVNLVDPNIKPIELIAPRGTAGAIAFRPDGKELALGSTGGVHLFDLTKLGKK